MRRLIILLAVYFSISSLFAQPADSGYLTPTILPCSSVKDQYLSATCWSFAGNSFLESELIKKGINGIDLSEMFIARNAWEQKTLLHLQYKGQNCLTPGGQFHNIVWAIKKYGLVPEAAYNGKPNGEKNHNHGNLDTAITRYITSLVKQKKTTPTATDWTFINNTINKYLGKTPASFLINGVAYTPQSYLKSLPLNVEDYIEITSYTHHPYYKPYVFENKYNFSFDKYMNVPLADFMAITDSALANGYTVLWNGDVTDDGFDFNKGIAVLYDVKDVASLRQQSFVDSTSYMDHMMHIVGFVKDGDGRKWYYVKNSWGVENSLKGYLMMDENYFAIKTAAIVVNKKAIPTSILSKLK